MQLAGTALVRTAPQMRSATLTCQARGVKGLGASMVEGWTGLGSVMARKNVVSGPLQSIA